MNETSINISFQRVAHFLIVIVILTYVLIVGKDIFVPLVFAALLGFMLKPLCDFIERTSGNRVFAAILTLFCGITPLIVAAWFFGVQLQRVFTELPDIMAGIEEGLEEISDYASDIFNLRNGQADKWISDGVDGAVEKPFDYISAGLAISSALLLRSVMTVIYLFIFLLYRTPIKRFIMQQFGRSEREEVFEVIQEVQMVAKDYFTGMLTVMLILGVLNTVGLYAIGLDYAPLWGFLAAALAAIPYVGTILGGLLPFLYSFAAGDGYWQPIQIIMLYSIIQSLEGNFITPKVVGRSVNINPLFALLALFVGEAIWGLVGMVVAIPLLAIVRITLDHLDQWKPVALLLSDDLYSKSHLYEEEFDAPK